MSETSLIEAGNVAGVATMTPGAAAKRFAAEHPDAAGRIRVVSYTPKGRGGWGRAVKDTLFFVTGGKAAQTRGTRRGIAWPHSSVHNGRCAVCGEVFLQPVLRTLFAPDPQAGEPVPDDVIAKRILPGFDLDTERIAGRPIVWAAHARISACPQCAEAYGLVDDLELEGPLYLKVYDKAPVLTLGRQHPELSRFGEPELAVVDVRGGDYRVREAAAGDAS